MKLERALYPAVFLSSLVSFGVSQAAEFIPLGGVSVGGPNVRSISDDGSIVIGRETLTPESSGFHWTASTGMVPFDAPDATVMPGAFGMALSGDGSIAAITGHTAGSPADYRAYHWTETGGYTNLGGLDQDAILTVAHDISRDGGVIVGWSRARKTSDGLQWLADAFRWTEQTGMVSLGTLDSEAGSEANAISSNGEVVVGESAGEAFRWTAGAGMVGLGTNGYTSSVAHDASADGATVLVSLQNGTGTPPLDLALWKETTGWSVIESTVSRVGNKFAMSDDASVVALTKPIEGGDGFAAFLWTESDGTRLFADLLRDDFGLGAQIDGWSMDDGSYLTAVSRNGRFVAGSARNPDGQPEAFLVDLGAPIPEPTTAALALLAVAGPLALRWRRSSGGAGA